jgi:hypothetical protein
VRYGDQRWQEYQAELLEPFCSETYATHGSRVNAADRVALLIR